MLKKMRWWVIAELYIAINVIALEIFGLDKHAFIAVILQEIVTIIFFHKIIHQMEKDERETKKIEEKIKELEEINKLQQEQIDKLSNAE